MNSNVMSVNRALFCGQNGTVGIQNPPKEIPENVEHDKLSSSENEILKKSFMEKYGYLDPIMCQLCLLFIIPLSFCSFSKLPNASRSSSSD